MKLKSSLKSLSREALEEMLLFWELPPAAEPLDLDQMVEYLYPRLQNAKAFEKVLEKIDKGERDLIHFLAIHGGNLEEKELRRRCFDNDRQGMQQTVDSLVNRGLLCVEVWKELDDKPRLVGIPEPYLRFIDLPHVWKGYLGGLLRDQPTEQLQRIATDGLALKAPTNKRDHLIYLLRKALTDPERLRSYIDSRNPSEREILLLIFQRRGVCLYRDLLESSLSRSPEQNRNEAVERLLGDSGLLFLASSNPVRHQNLLRVPRDIYHIVTQDFAQDNRGLKELDAMSQVDPKGSPKMVLDNGVSILRDVVVLAGAIARQRMRQLANGGVGKKDLKKILPQLSAGKTLKYAQFLAFYCIRQKYLVPMGDHWRVSNPFQKNLSDARKLYVDLYSCWHDTTEWNEEYIDGNCLHTDTFPNNLVDIVELRKIVLANLAGLPFDTWVDGPRFIESLLAQIELRMPKRGGRARPDKHNRLNYLVIESILCETLYWLGVVSLGFPEISRAEVLGNRSEASEGSGAGPVADSAVRLDQRLNFNPRPLQSDLYQFHFKINNLGRSLLEIETGDFSKIHDQKTAISLPFRDDLTTFTILPNLDVIAPPDLNLAHFFTLTAFAEIRQMDVMSTLHISHGSLRDAMDHGMGKDQILDFLKAGSPNGLPETVYHLIDECCHRYGEILIGYAGGFIEVEDPVLVEEIKSSKTLAPYIKDVLNNRVVLLGRGVDVQQVARELQRIGFMPSIDSEYVHTTAEDNLHFTISPRQLSNLIGILRFVQEMEEEIGAAVTEDSTRSLIHLLRPANPAKYNLAHYSEILAKQYARNFDAALKKQVNSITGKYRKQVRELLARRTPAAARAGYKGPSPATAKTDLTRMIRYAIENEALIEMQYVRSTQEEINEQIRPESLSGDRLFAFCESSQAYCAYRLSRVRSMELA